MAEALFEPGDLVYRLSNPYHLGRVLIRGQECEQDPNLDLYAVEWPDRSQSAVAANEMRKVGSGRNVAPRSEVEFTREGGFAYNGRGPNPFAPPPAPPSPPQRTVCNQCEMSSLAEAWGTPYSVDERRQYFIDHVSESVFNRIDRGSLLRIARAVEEQARTVKEQAKEIKALRKEMKEMMSFWKELRKDYRKQKRIEDGD